MATGRASWFLTFLAGAAGIVFLALAVSNAADGEYGWAALLAVLALPGLYAAYRAQR